MDMMKMKAAPKSGMQMLLASMGIDAADIMHQIEAAKVGIPAFAAAIDTRITSLETKLDNIHKLLLCLHNSMVEETTDDGNQHNG